MGFNWVRYMVSRKNIRVFWKPGHTNWGCFYKIFSKIRKVFLINALQEVKFTLFEGVLILYLIKHIQIVCEGISYRK